MTHLTGTAIGLDGAAAAPRPDGEGDPRAVPVRHPGRWLAMLVVLLLAIMLGHSLATNRNFQWHVVGEYLFSTVIVNGLLLTLELTVIAMLAGIVLGVIAALMRLSPNPIVSGAGGLYVWFFRGTPVYVQILFWYNVSALYPRLSLGIPFGPEFVHGSVNSIITALTAACLALGLNEGAYMAEIVRAGLLSVDAGQTEAAQALGMSRALTMRLIVLPQAMRIIIPPTGNETIGMLKTTSLVSIIAVSELLRAAQNVYSRTYQTIPLLIVASIWYITITTVLSIGQFYIERRFARGAARASLQGPLLSLARGLLAVPGRKRAIEPVSGAAS
ncbi:MAG: amino acid ABC transporter permease [Jatrophihabitantaceae bacterium]